MRDLYRSTGELGASEAPARDPTLPMPVYALEIRSNKYQSASPMLHIRLQMPYILYLHSTYYTCTFCVIVERHM